MLNETAQNLLTSGDFTPVQTLLAAGIKDADTIHWDELELAQADLNDLLGYNSAELKSIPNNAAKTASEFVNFGLEDATLSCTFEFSASVNLKYFRVRVVIREGIHTVVALVVWDEKQIDYLSVDTKRSNKNPTDPPVAMLRKLHVALERIGIPVQPLGTWFLHLNKEFYIGVPAVDGFIFNQAAIDWVKAPLQSDESLIRHARYVASTFEALPAIADREMAMVPFAVELGNTMRNHMWQSICQITAAAYGLSYDSESGLWRMTIAATDDAWYEFQRRQFTTAEACNNVWGQLCANIQRTHRDLNAALKGLI